MGKFNNYLDIEVSCKDVNEGNARLLSFYGIKSPNDMKAILDRLLLPAQDNTLIRQVHPNKNIQKAWAKSGVLFVIVPKGQEDAFIETGLKSIQMALIKSGGYDNESILRLTDEVGQRFETPNKEEMNKMFSDAAASEIDMWTTYINNMNDPEMVKVLELYSKIYGNTDYGHLLSLKNAMTIRHLDPTATFVCGKTTWANWGYGIKRGAKKFPLWGGNYKLKKELSSVELKKAMEELGHGLEEFGDLGVAVQQAVTIKASQDIAKKDKVFVPFRYIGYDISDTYRYNTNEDDPLTSKPNIASNVILTLNALAQAAEDKKKAERGENITGDDEMKQKTEKALAKVIEICNEKNIQVPEQQNQTPSATLVNCLIDLYSSMVQSKANVLKAGNIQNIAEDCTHLSLIMSGVGLDQLNRFRHPLTYTVKEMNALAPMLRYIIPQIGKAMFAEAVFDDFMVRLKSAMKQIGMKVVKDRPEIPDNSNVQQPENNVETPMNTPEMVTESFNKWVARITNADISKPTSRLW